MNKIVSRPNCKSEEIASRSTHSAAQPRRRRRIRSADFQVCRIAGFQTGPAQNVARAADLEIGDTAGLETCATVLRRCVRALAKNAAGILSLCDRLSSLAFLSLSLAFGASLTALAQNPIEITKSPNYIVPVSISGFTGEAEAVLKFDLYVLGMQITAPDKAEYQVTGSDSGNVQGRLTHGGDSTPLFSKAYSGGSIRSQAHALADDIVKEIRGTPPIFHSRIAFRIQEGQNAEIGVADFDGHDAMAVTQDHSLVATPCWVPGRRMLLYTTWKNDDAEILAHNLASGARSVFAHYPGSAFSPEVSPDGHRVAMILSKSGSPNVWVCDLDGGGLTQLTFTRDEASCPSWSPDGQEICYVERRGRAALRKVNVNGGPSTPLHVVGPAIFGNITAPDWSPDGKQIVFTVGSGNFNICVASSDGGQAQRLVAGEDPCWAPNSRTVIFTRREGYKHTLCLLDVPTKHVKDIRQVPGSCSQPAWAR